MPTRRPGAAFQRALELRVEQLNGSGLTGGRTVRLVVKDNRSDPAESLRNIADFTGDRAVSAIIMGSCGQCAVNAAKTLNAKAIPAISLAAAGAVASPVAERRFMFKVGPNANDNAAALAAELRRTPGSAQARPALHPRRLRRRRGWRRSSASWARSG